MTTPTQLIVCLFESETQADTARQTLEQSAEPFNSLKLGNIAIVRKDAEGKISLYKTQAAKNNEFIAQSPLEALDAAIEMGTMESTGPIGFALYAIVDELVALVTGAVSRIVDFGFPDSALQQIGAGLENGKSALITLVKLEDAEKVTNQLMQQGGTAVQQTIAPEIIEQLRAKVKGGSGSGN